MKNNRIQFLDYMRVIAFLSVLIGHKFFPYIASISHHHIFSPIARGLIPLCLGGAAGVIIFFLTSGYITTHVLFSDTPIEFLLKRIFRIYPLYIIAVFLEAFLAWKVAGVTFPSFSLLGLQLLLLGDFFDAPYALAGVEWTLRIEIIFYLFMMLLNAIGLFTQPKKMVFTFILCCILLSLAKPFPTITQWSYGYFTLYAPFLLFGSTIYLIEKNLSNKNLCILLICGIYFSFRIKLLMIQPVWARSIYPEVGIGLFISAWKFQKFIYSGQLINFFSSLTYSVYLFHNWMWHYLEMLLLKIEIINHPILLQLQVLLLLLGICYVLHHSIKKKGIDFGGYILKEHLWKVHSLKRRLKAIFIERNSPLT